MAISSTTDIIMDVVRAADPEAVGKAREKLEAIASARAPTEAFDAAGRIPAPRLDAKGKVPDIFVKFEAMILQNFMQSMLPEESEAVYGAGLAGDMWRSLLAQELATQTAKAGGIGIAARVLGNHYVDGEKTIPVAGVTPEPVRAAIGDQALLSTALVQEMERAMARKLDEDRAALDGKSGI